ncbi:hypothetical protein [Metallibacterium scheffleri]|uniref:Uncharacterized protein n=1 Tax=Metallibacterium scheffleri TaxID=993689 RepID=A0A4S3KTP8_9GAMM|nr:hypothetical protein [Metallibacterium scheffleri]THD11634.1 hypothetical protein B1806_02550 [Metallibacterium scheffleri]
MNGGTFVFLFLLVAVSGIVVEVIKAIGNAGSSKGGIGSGQRRKALSDADLRAIGDLFTATMPQEVVDMTPPAATSAEPVMQTTTEVKATSLATVKTAIATMWHGGAHNARGLVHAVRWAEEDSRWNLHRKINKKFDAQLRKERRRHVEARKLADRLEEVMRLEGELA